MANPEIKNITKDTWVKVATNVFTGTISKLSNKPSHYIQTFRISGEAAPTLKNEGVLLFSNLIEEPILSSVGIDVYIMCFKNDGSIRVDV